MRHGIPNGGRADHAGRGLGCAILGWAVFLIVLAGIVFFGYRTLSYYKLIRSGDLVDLPQFTGKLTAVSGTSRISSSFVEPDVVEGGTHPSIGGGEEPELTIVEFADFECPYSREAHAVVRRLAAKYGDRVRVIYRDYPIESIHPSAFQAAVAAECANEQGKFWAYHDKLYANSHALDFQDLLRYAAEMGLDERQFEKCLVDERYRDRVSADLRTAENIGLRGTPTFFFDGQRVEGSIPEADFERIIERMLR